MIYSVLQIQTCCITDEILPKKIILQIGASAWFTE